MEKKFRQVDWTNIERIGIKMSISIRKMNSSDIDLKVKWINNKKNNRHLHYKLPLDRQKTLHWYEQIKDNQERFDGIIEYNGIPVGLIGLLNIVDSSAEYYIAIGECEYLGKGIAKIASKLLLQKAFKDYNLEKVILYTEIDNYKAQRLFESIGFKRLGLADAKVYNPRLNEYVERYIYEISKSDFIRNIICTPIENVKFEENNLFIKRDDLLPFSFGGNKARKAELFFKEIIEGKYDYVVTYGSSSSNHCRIVANKAVSLNIPCIIISPEENNHETTNSKMMSIFNAKIVNVKIKEVKETIDDIMIKLKNEGFNPYFIQGGGHGNLGTQAYVDAFQEINEYSKNNNINFDYIFHASGTGTTQAGLICGKLLSNSDVKIIGISIARKCPYGRNVIINSIKEYLEFNKIEGLIDRIEESTIFIDEYVGEGYGFTNKNVTDVIKQVLKNYGIPLDSTYTGKAFYGMLEYIKKYKLTDKKILFIHTGGTPLFFDTLGGL